jgi:hypothetical protein
MDDQSTFVECTLHHTTMNKQWKHDIEAKRDLARNYLITGGDQISDTNDEINTIVVTNVDSAIQAKGQVNVIPPVTSTKMITAPTQFDIANEFTLNDQQKFAFMIITGHLNDDSQFRTGISCTFLHTIFIYAYHR